LELQTDIHATRCFCPKCLNYLNSFTTLRARLHFRGVSWRAKSSLGRVLVYRVIVSLKVDQNGGRENGPKMIQWGVSKGKVDEIFRRQCLDQIAIELLVYQGCGLLTKVYRTSRMDFKLAEPLRLAHKTNLNSILGILCPNAIYQ